MASATPKGQLPAAVEAPKPTPLVQAISTHDTSASRLLASARPALLLALLAFRFPDFVEDPVSDLQFGLGAVALLQVTYAVVCLPAAGSQSAKPTKKPRPGERKRHDGSGPNLIVTSILSLVLTAIATGIVHFVFVLFGAPFLDHVQDTLLTAAHFSLIALFPIFYVRGVDGQALLAVAGASAPIDETFGGLIGAVAGAWLGAVPIPLDWDREWQKWPVTIVTGMYVGHALGARVVGSIFFGKRLGTPSSVDEEE